MSIDILNDDLLTLSQVASAIPAIGGKKITTTTIARWIKKGVRGVRLEGVKVGDRLCTTKDALDRFMQRTSPSQSAQADEKQSVLRSSRADRRLRADGF